MLLHLLLFPSPTNLKSGTAQARYKFSRTYAGAEFSVYSYYFLKKGMPFCRRSTKILLLL